MKLITVLIDNRVDCVLNLDSSTTLAFTPSYLVNRSENEYTDLLTFYSDDSQSIIFQTNKKESLYVKSIEVEKDDNADKHSQSTTKEEVLEIKITFSKNRPNPPANTEMLAQHHLELCYPKNSSHIVLRYRPTPQIQGCMAHVTCEIENAPDCKRDINLFVCSKDQVADVVLDFGSEASQMAVFARDETQTIGDIAPIFSDVKEMIDLKSAGAESSELHNADSTEVEHQVAQKYIQKEEGDDNGHLYKSIFFAKKKIEDDKFESSAYSLVGDNPYLNILTTPTQAEAMKHDFIRLPNVKITGFGGVEEPRVQCMGTKKPISKVGNGFFYRSSINSFLLVALKKAASMGRAYVSFHILMPNVYSQQDIFKRVGYICRDIMEMIQNDEVKGITAFEVSVISESDASLLGTICEMHTRGQALKDGNYLILDAGKGTLDYSVLSKHTSNTIEYRNIHRAGLIGAGNALSYAYLFVILHHYLKLMTGQDPSKADLQRFIAHNIVGTEKGPNTEGAGDLSYLRRLMTAVDQYKVAVGKFKGIKTTEKSPDYSIVMDDIQLQTLVHYAEGLCDEKQQCYTLINDVPDYVKFIIDIIVDTTCSSLAMLKGKGIDDGVIGSLQTVVFAGRGFKHQQLKTAMMERLVKEEVVDAESELILEDPNSRATLKNICLFISEPLISGQYNNMMMSAPLLSPNRTNLASEKEDWYAPTAIIKKIKGALLRKKKSSGDVKTWQGSVTGGALIEMISNSANYYVPGGDPSENGYVSGFEVDVLSPDDILYVGGTPFKLNSAGTKRMFLVDGKFVLRDEDDDGNIQDLGSRLDLRTSRLLIPSLFPYCSVKRVDDIFIPFTEIEYKKDVHTAKDITEETCTDDYKQEISARSKSIKGNGGKTNDEIDDEIINRTM